MLGRKISLKKLAKKVKVIGKGNELYEASQQECLLRGNELEDQESEVITPTGFFAVYVGEVRERFVVPTSFLNHPLFKMLLEKSFNESIEFDQKNKLVVPCSVSTFQEVVNAVGCCNGRFDFGNLVEEFI
ncbi:auxin-induced protein X15 [Mercurialis annua]|uniref:auxin-induced protein X15 n=1 Tax=Mercurialis annua TaxID=3986 RepID=UPI00215EE638|nr:auxin-induced protein X15 [Mercurialis annua]